MANTYIEHIAISSPKTASIFSNEITWKILEFLRKAGAKGLTEEEINQKFEKEKTITASTSQIYSVLKRLYEMEWVHRYWDKESRARRHVIAYIWGGIALDEEFSEVIDKKMSPLFKEKLFPILLECCEEALQRLSQDKKTKQWLPSQSDLCINCNESHEAREFFDAILETVLIQFEESEEFKNLLKENDFAIDELSYK